LDTRYIIDCSEKEFIRNILPLFQKSLNIIGCTSENSGTQRTIMETAEKFAFLCTRVCLSLYQNKMISEETCIRKLNFIFKELVDFVLLTERIEKQIGRLEYPRALIIKLLSEKGLYEYLDKQLLNI